MVEQHFGASASEQPIGSQDPQCKDGGKKRENERVPIARAEEMHDGGDAANQAAEPHNKPGDVAKDQYSPEQFPVSFS